MRDAQVNNILVFTIFVSIHIERFTENPLRSIRGSVALLVSKADSMKRRNYLYKHSKHSVFSLFLFKKKKKKEVAKTFSFECSMKK